MRTEYKRDMNHNYLILTGDERIDTDSSVSDTGNRRKIHGVL